MSDEPSIAVVGVGAIGGAMAADRRDSPTPLNDALTALLAVSDSPLSIEME
jgi:hypothetical protein